MRVFKSILGVAVASALLGVSLTSNAQENANRDENGRIVRGSYLTNGFCDNWFVGVGGGANFMASGSSFEAAGAAVDIFAGKWITPSVGLRFGWRGLNNVIASDGVLSGEHFGQNLVKVDLMWNVSNAFSGYKETRIWDVIPYAGFGVIRTSGIRDYPSGIEYAANVGIQNDFRLGKRLDLYLDIATVVARGKGIVPDGSVFALLPSATVGVMFNLGRTNFDRHASVVPVVVPVPFTTDQYNALKNRVAELEKENAALKDELDALKNKPQDTVYVKGGSDVDPYSRTFFEIGSFVLSVREKAHLDFFAQNVVAANEDAVYTVTGYADNSTGSASWNQKLSERRAKAVMDYLVKATGLDESKFQIVGMGGVDSGFRNKSYDRSVEVRIAE